MNFFKHPNALVESDAIGKGTRIWAFAHVMAGARIGDDCNIGDHAFIEEGVTVGDRVTIKNQVFLCKGVEIEDDVFVGPGAVFTNDLRPRSPRMCESVERYCDESNWLAKTMIRRGASVGAAATIRCGVTVGKFAMVAAGAVVTSDVAPYELVMGVPAKSTGHVCVCGQKLEFIAKSARCECGELYELAGSSGQESCCRSRTEC